MFELYFNYFTSTLIGITFAIIIYFNAIKKKKYLFIGYSIITIIILVALYDIINYPSIFKLRDHYLSYKSLNIEEVIELNYYNNDSEYKREIAHKTITDKEKIRLFLDKSNLDKGLYFTDVTTENGYPEYIVEVILINEKYTFEILKDIDGFEVIGFIMPSSNKKLNQAGRYYFDSISEE